MDYNYLVVPDNNLGPLQLVAAGEETDGPSLAVGAEVALGWGVTWDSD